MKRKHRKPGISLKNRLSALMGLSLRQKIFLTTLAVIICLPVLFIHKIEAGYKMLRAGADSEISIAAFTNAAPAAVSAKRQVISVPTGMVKSNPFVPYRDISNTVKVTDIPAYNLVEPPEAVNANSDAARVMDTIVSGILYDKYSPSAILNIEGNDYLVKKGDVVNNYKVVSILQDSVTVQLGSNTYKAGIGEILTEGSVNYNEVSNLSKKFGGEK